MHNKPNELKTFHKKIPFGWVHTNVYAGTAQECTDNPWLPDIPVEHATVTVDYSRLAKIRPRNSRNAGDAVAAYLGAALEAQGYSCTREDPEDRQQTFHLNITLPEPVKRTTLLGALAHTLSEALNAPAAQPLRQQTGPGLQIYEDPSQEKGFTL